MSSISHGLRVPPRRDKMMAQTPSASGKKAALGSVRTSDMLVPYLWTGVSV